MKPQPMTRPETLRGDPDDGVRRTAPPPGDDAARSDVVPRRPRWRRRVVGLVLLLGAVVPMLNACLVAPRYTGATSDHFDGRVFRNQVPLPEDRGWWDVLTWRWQRDVDSWDGWVAPAVESEVVPRVEGERLRVTFVNHATVLLQTAGLNILTDPIWSDRASPFSGAGPARHGPPGVAFEDLPPIDLVVVSHNHYDHLDLATLALLADAHAPALVVPLGNTALLESAGIDGARDVDWWETVVVGDARVTCVPAQHFSGRGLTDRNATLWAGYVIETPGGVIYFAGDTGGGPHFAQVRERFGTPRLALLPMGAYEPRWFMAPVHLDPREAAEAHLTLGAQQSMGVHFRCFELADEAPEAPAEELRTAIEELAIEPSAFWVPVAGEAREVRR